MAFWLLLWQLHNWLQGGNLPCAQAVIPAKAVDVETILSWAPFLKIKLEKKWEQKNKQTHSAPCFWNLWTRTLEHLGTLLAPSTTCKARNAFCSIFWGSGVGLDFEQDLFVDSIAALCSETLNPGAGSAWGMCWWKKGQTWSLARTFNEVNEWLRKVQI